MQSLRQLFAEDQGSYRSASSSMPSHLPAPPTAASLPAAPPGRDRPELAPKAQPPGNAQAEGPAGRRLWSARRRPPMGTIFPGEGQRGPAPANAGTANPGDPEDECQRI